MGKVTLVELARVSNIALAQFLQVVLVESVQANPVEKRLLVDEALEEVHALKFHFPLEADVLECFEDAYTVCVGGRYWQAREITVLE